MLNFIVFILLFFPQLAFSKGSVDIVFDIDQTIATKIHDGIDGDWLADPRDPKKNVITISYDEVQMDHMNKILRDPTGAPLTKPVTESYRVYEGVEETLERLIGLESSGVRVSFFSGGPRARNEAILSALKLSNGQSVKERLSQASGRRMFGREDMTATGKGVEARIRERFKKDLRLINPNLDDVVLVDDIKNFVPDDQLEHVLWLDEDFPYPERKSGVVPGPIEIEKERNKFKRLSSILEESLIEKKSSELSFSKIVQKRSLPFQIHHPCSQGIYSILGNLLSTP